MSAAAYWDREYAENAEHHSRQNRAIADTLIKGTFPAMRSALKNADSIIEIGCGTGEFIATVCRLFGQTDVFGVDASMEAVRIASRRHSDVQFFSCGILEMVQTEGDPYDLAICSNTLEHFKDPGAVIDRIFTFADKLLVVVPLGQTELDAYECEGGAGHVSSFDHTSFVRWRVLESVTFRTDGWSCESSSMQWAVLLEPRDA